MLTGFPTGNNKKKCLILNFPIPILITKYKMMQLIELSKFFAYNRDIISQNVQIHYINNVCTGEKQFVSMSTANIIFIIPSNLSLLSPF